MDLLIPTTAPLLAEPSSGIIRFFPQASLLNSLQLTFPTGEVNTFFPRENRINIGRYPFSPYKVRQKWEKDLQKPSLEELMGSFHMVVAECGLFGWAFIEACN